MLCAVQRALGVAADLGKLSIACSVRACGCVNVDAYCARYAAMAGWTLIVMHTVLLRAAVRLSILRSHQHPSSCQRTVSIRCTDHAVRCCGALKSRLRALEAVHCAAICALFPCVAGKKNSFPPDDGRDMNINHIISSCHGPAVSCSERLLCQRDAHAANAELDWHQLMPLIVQIVTISDQIRVEVFSNGILGL